MNLQDAHRIFLFSRSLSLRPVVISVFDLAFRLDAAVQVLGGFPYEL